MVGFRSVDRDIAMFEAAAIILHWLISIPRPAWRRERQQEELAMAKSMQKSGLGLLNAIHEQQYAALLLWYSTRGEMKAC
ncbi:hypothetical protein [Bradyrhizobium japonicum]|jgi:hypothetical protein|uniref:Transposase n=2 Tax=Bradyrhizobium japonicum TaxID=375 RepID=A0ABV2S562_BRAJP|nr:hypothetical protein [Bradyrhizobium japonicum]MCP1759266.1 hypothetical protein [Bradyrhizobium japonicum]MCP1790775.1 hypothetical protein [Bradyrhizobium japonicum]MCP1803275.1 hypothetical protein [Bradyrhizobium japonicum]MCP1866910.1 hypothetical protein [Bradyrhizobium japonicum]MCP1880150.1 hypothetical protein [Bradyrhizobium japonicum]